MNYEDKPKLNFSFLDFIEMKIFATFVGNMLNFTDENTFLIRDYCM